MPRPNAPRPDRAPRIVVIDHTAILGGAELALERLLDLLRHEFSIHVLLFADGPLVERLRGAGHHVEVLPMAAELATARRHAVGRSPVAAVANALRTVPFAFRLARRLRTLAPDVVHTTSLKADLVGVVAAPLAGLPLVWHIHDRISSDYLPEPLVALIHALARVPRAVVVNSCATASTLPGLPTVLAYPGFGPDQMGPRPSDRTPPPTPVVGLMGRISPTKGQLEFVRSAALVRREIPEARFRIIGSAMFNHEAYAASIRDEVAALNLEEAVEFTGFVDNPASALDALSLCVHASPTPEPFGQVIVEAMIRGVPVVATRGGGATEIIEPADGGPALGWAVDPYDVEGLAAAMVDALRHPEEAERRAAAAWDSAVERFPISRTAEVVSSVWRDVARGR